MNCNLLTLSSMKFYERARSHSIAIVKSQCIITVSGHFLLSFSFLWVFLLVISNSFPTLEEFFALNFNSWRNFCTSSKEFYRKRFTLIYWADKRKVNKVIYLWDFLVLFTVNVQIRNCCYWTCGQIVDSEWRNHFSFIINAREFGSVIVCN